MKRQWDIEELIEHFTLIEEDLEVLANKAGPTRLGCALLLKCFQDDLSKDFEERRTEYDEALGQPEKVEVFISTLSQQMIDTLTSFDQGGPKLSAQVRILDKKGGWISLTPLTAQPEPQNLRKLKAETVRRWGVTSLLDILKEAALRMGFTERFKGSASREVLDREVLQKRLLLCLYASA